MYQPFEDPKLPKPIPYATLWSRFWAMLIDYFILIIPILFLTDMGPLGKLIIFVGQWVYFAVQESGPAQASFGKRAMHLKVTDMNGNAISFWKATGRYFSKYISALILGIGFLMVFWDEKGQGLHDKMAGTTVIYKE